MELWVYDGGRAVLGIIERYSSLRLTRRYDGVGEMDLTAPLAAMDDAARLTPGCIVWPKGFDEAYIIESVTLVACAGGTRLQAGGRTLSALLERRCLPDLACYNGTAGYVIRQLTRAVFSDNARAFPGWVMRVADGAGRNISLLTNGETLLTAIETVCRGGGLGYRTAFDSVSGAMEFQLYEGVDRWSESAPEPVMLDPEYDNLMGLTAVDSVHDHLNVAYILGAIDPSTGVPRKIVVDASTESGLARSSGLDRFERAIPFTAACAVDSVATAVGGTGGLGGTTALTEAQYGEAMRTYAANRLRAAERGVAISGAVEFSGWPEVQLGDIVRVRAKVWDTDTSARVRMIETRVTDGVVATLATLGYV